MLMLNIDTIFQIWQIPLFISQFLTLLLRVVMCSWVLGDSESVWWCIQFLQWALHLEKLSNRVECWFLDSFYVLKVLEGNPSSINLGVSQKMWCRVGFKIWRQECIFRESEWERKASLSVRNTWGGGRKGRVSPTNPESNLLLEA